MTPRKIDIGNRYELAVDFAHNSEIVWEDHPYLYLQAFLKFWGSVGVPIYSNRRYYPQISSI